jgi:hypothetical protein
MPDVGAALRGRTFGIPNGVLLAAVAVGIWFVFLRRPAAGPGASASSRPQSSLISRLFGTSTSTQAGQAGSALESGYGLGYAQGQQSSQANVQPPAPPAAPTPPAPPAAPVAKANGTVWLHSQPSATSPVAGILAQGQTVPTTGSPVQGENFCATYLPGNPCSNAWVPVTYAGAPAFAFSLDVTVQAASAPIGGPGTSRKHAIGSRSAAPQWHDSHPLIGAPVQYAHYVRVGGAKTHAAHSRNVARVASQAGVHPARIAMLNPNPTNLIRIA